MVVDEACWTEGESFLEPNISTCLLDDEQRKFRQDNDVVLLSILVKVNVDLPRLLPEISRPARLQVHFPVVLVLFIDLEVLLLVYVAGSM